MSVAHARHAVALAVLWGTACALPGTGGVPAAFADAPPPARVLAGPRTAPRFTARTIDGKTVDLAGLIRRGPVLLDFWATWCQPCVASLPELQALQQKYRARGLTVLAISVDGPRNYAKVRPFVSRYDLTLPVVLDEDGSLQERYHVRAVPTSILIDTTGTIAHVQTGYRPGVNDDVAAALEALCPAASDSSRDSSHTEPHTP